MFGTAKGGRGDSCVCVCAAVIHQDLHKVMRKGGRGGRRRRRGLTRRNTATEVFLFSLALISLFPTFAKVFWRSFFLLQYFGVSVSRRHQSSSLSRHPIITSEQRTASPFLPLAVEGSCSREEEGGEEEEGFAKFTTANF